MRRIYICLIIFLALTLAACGSTRSESGNGGASQVVQEADPPTTTPEPTQTKSATNTATPGSRATSTSTSASVEASIANTDTATATPPPAETETSVPPTDTAEPTLEPTATETAPTPTGTPQPATATATRPVLPPVTNTPMPASVFVRSHTSYPADGGLIVVGELVNGGENDVFGPRVIGQFYDSGGNIIAAGQAQASFGKLEIERPSPFRMTVAVDPSSVARYELAVTWEEISLLEFRELEVTDAAVVDRSGQLAVVGELYNPHESALTSMVVAVAFYDENGDVVDVADIFLGGQTIAADGTFSFELPLPNAERTYTSMRVLAQGQVNLF